MNPLSEWGRFRGTEAEHALRSYLQAKVENLKEKMVNADGDRDAIAAQIRILREVLKELSPEMAERHAQLSRV